MVPRSGVSATASPAYSALVASRSPFHGLRHSYGTALAAQGVPRRTLQEWMGHRDIQTTQRHADYCPDPGERDVVESAFARGTNPGTNLRLPQRTESN
jgi:integrase